MSKREKMIAGVTGAAVALFALNHYALEPYVARRTALSGQRESLVKQGNDASRTFDRQRRLAREWRNMEAGGLKSDAGEAEQQLYEAVRDWAREAGVSVATSDPQRVPNPKDRIQVVRLRVTGTGSQASFAKLLWKAETSPLPVKVDEFTLVAQPQGTDNLNVTLAVSTIWVRPPSPDDAKAPRAPAPRRPTGEDL
jgi:hypothetical protein